MPHSNNSPLRRDLAPQNVPLDELKPLGRETRKHTASQIRKLASGLEHFGFRASGRHRCAAQGRRGLGAGACGKTARAARGAGRHHQRSVRCRTAGPAGCAQPAWRGIGMERRGVAARAVRDHRSRSRYRCHACPASRLPRSMSCSLAARMRKTRCRLLRRKLGPSRGPETCGCSERTACSAAMPSRRRATARHLVRHAPSWSSPIRPTMSP